MLNLDAVLRRLTVKIVGAYVENHDVATSEIADLIISIHDCLGELSLVRAAAKSAPSELKRPARHMPPEMPRSELPTTEEIKASVKTDGIVSFIDGKTYRSLKKHVKANGFSPMAYREYFGLPRSYPMAAPSYAAKMSLLARKAGLGVVITRFETKTVPLT